jgi:hypothetical protein
MMTMLIVRENANIITVTNAHKGERSSALNMEVRITVRTRVRLMAYVASIGVSRMLLPGVINQKIKPYT